jgi:galactose mutarotase-like enzyme
MYFSIGGHPAFNTTLFDTDVYEDWVIHFENDSYKTYPLNGNFQSGNTEELKLNNSSLTLNTNLFQKDAIIFKNNDIKSVTLSSTKHKSGLKFATDMPNFGIWSPKNTKEFVCLEPWCGIADSQKSTEIKDKEQIIELAQNKIHTSHYQIEIF